MKKIKIFIEDAFRNIDIIEPKVNSFIQELAKRQIYDVDIIPCGNDGHAYYTLIWDEPIEKDIEKD